MNESTKTGIFAGVAATIALATWLTAPNIRDSTLDDLNAMVGKDLFEKYDPLSAAALKIVKYDEELGKVKEFEVVRDKASGAWSIPSNSGYNADAAQQMSEAANTFINLKVLGIASTRRDEQSLFGVMEPNPEKLQVGDKGVGLLVRMKDQKDNTLVDLIIGKPDKDKPNHRFVRKANEDVIYAVAIKTDALSTDFTRWIESDLLKLSSNDIEVIGVRDYAILPTAEGQVLKKNFEADLYYNTADAKWEPKSITLHEGPQPTPRTLTDAEQLNATKLNEIKNALDSLKIADVVRKPNGLAADLKADKSLVDDQSSIISLARRGFLLGSTPQGSEMFASSGELIVTLKDGVQYVIRFGNSSGQSTDSENKDPKAGDDKKDDLGLGLDRYMLVSARLDESRYPEPALKQLPETFEDLLRMEADAKAKETKLDAEPATPGLGIDAAQPSNLKADTNPASDLPKEKSLGENADANATEKKVEPNKDSEKPELKSGDQSRIVPAGKRFVTYQQSGESQTPAPPEPSQVPAAPADKTVSENPAEKPAEELTADEKKERLEAARERITKENQRLIDERNEKLDAAKKKAAELNARFAEWYYIIAESEYKRLRVKFDELIQPKGAATTPASGAGGMPNFGAGGIPNFGPGN